MTLSMMRQWGMDSVWNGNEIRVLPGRYKPVHFSVESDWSAASYWYEIAALVPGAVVELSGLHDVSVQGDSRVSEFLPIWGWKPISYMTVCVYAMWE